MTFKALTIDSTICQGIVDSIVTDAVALGYSCVESRYVHGENIWAVIKSPASLNYFASDYYIALGCDSGTSLIGACLFEEWSTSSKMAGAFAPGIATSWRPTNSYTCGRSPAMLHSSFSFATTSRMFYQATVPAVVANDQCYYSITPDRLVLGIVSNSNNNFTRGAFYVGAYERFLPSSLDPVPVCITRLPSANQALAISVSNGNSGSGAATREPGATSWVVDHFAAGYFAPDRTYVGGSDAWTPFGLSGLQRKDANYTENEYYTNRPFVSRIPVTGRQENAVRGLFIGLYLIGSPISQSGTEMTWTFAGNTYTAVKVRGTGGGVSGNGGQVPNNIYAEKD
jgi:hypothetical protein